MSEKEKHPLLLDPGMMELFTQEVETQTAILNDGIVLLEKEPSNLEKVTAWMRGAHSIKGAARVIGIHEVVELAHAFEDYFLALQSGRAKYKESDGDLLLEGVDLLHKITTVSIDKIPKWLDEKREEFRQISVAIRALSDPTQEQNVQSAPKITKRVKEKLESITTKKDPNRVLRVTAQNLNRLMGLAGESMVESRWLQPFSDMLLQLKKKHHTLSFQVDILQNNLKHQELAEPAIKALTMLHNVIHDCQADISNRISELDLFIGRHSSLTDRLYNEVIDSRMRPFEDGVGGFKRLIRDLAKDLHKKANLHIEGLQTPVDRDILDKLEAPLTHLLRNAIDHGIGTPEERVLAGKPEEGTITLKAEHRAGSLIITVSDDGRGINYENLKQRIREKHLAQPEMIDKLSNQELIDFLFLPGFSTAKTVTEISGRGVGLNVVQNMVQEVSGSIRVLENRSGGITFLLHLPLTLSVIRALITEINQEPYALPLGRINRALLVPSSEIEVIENRQYFTFQGENIGIISATEILGLEKNKKEEHTLSVVLLRDRADIYGIVVDAFLGEKELVLQDLDHRLGKVPNIFAGAFMEDGSPALVLDVDDIINSIDAFLSGGRSSPLYSETEKPTQAKEISILVVDDSITVREVESRLLRSHGYKVETAVNGMDAWNAIRLHHYDILITDIDMPRMNGIELLQMVRKDPLYADLPIMVVSYKEGEEDRALALEAGADYYMTKSSFHDQKMVEVIKKLLGKKK